MTKTYLKIHHLKSKLKFRKNFLVNLIITTWILPNKQKKLDVGALGIVHKILKKRLKELEIRGRIETIQPIPLLRGDRILGGVLGA